MATQQVDIVFSVADNAGIKAWGSAVSAAIQACGLVKTTDTGQIDWTTTSVTASGSLDQVFGYEIFKLNDSLQTSGKPIYLRVEYGAYGGQGYSQAGYSPSIWTTVGSATDGAGNISSAFSSGRYAHLTTAMSRTASVPCYFAGDGTYFFMLLGALKLTGGNNNNNTPFALLVLDRTRNAAGTANGDGWWTVRSCYNPAGYNIHQFTANVANAGTTGLGNPGSAWREDFVQLNRLTSHTRLLYSVFLVPGGAGTTGADGTDTTFYPLLVQSGEQAYTNALLCGFNNDVVNLQTYTTTVLGASHTYLAIQYTPTGMTNHCMLVRYE